MFNSISISISIPARDFDLNFVVPDDKVYLYLQSFYGRTHALLQEGGIDMVDILREEGF